MLKAEELLRAAAGSASGGAAALGTVDGFSIDSRTIKKGEAFIALEGVNFNGHDFIGDAVGKGASCVISEPFSSKERKKYRGVFFIEVQDTVKALGGIARYMRRKSGIPVVAVSGSNGKTTTKEMIAWVLSLSFNVLKNEGTKNNHIGLPQALLGLNEQSELAVLELGSNHFGEIDYLSGICEPNVGVLTNIGPSHLEFFNDLRGVFREKYSLIRNLRQPGIGILNSDDIFLNREMGRSSGTVLNLGFGGTKKCEFFADKIRPSGDKICFSVNNNKFAINSLGRHNVYNALAAIAVARIFGMEYKAIRKRLLEFDFPKGRLKVIRVNEASFIDDTYNSNPASFKNALAALSMFKTRGRKIVVMGDMLELGGERERLHSQAGEEAARVCDIFITVGELSRHAAESARGLGLRDIFVCSSAQEARRVLFDSVSLKKNDVVLVKGSRSMRMEGVFI